MKAEVFVSHSLNRHFAGLLRKELASQLETLGLQPFVAEAELEAGLPWRPQIYQHLEDCVGAVILLTPHSVARAWVRFESDVLLHRAAVYQCPRLLVLKVLAPGETLGSEDLKPFEPAQLPEIQSRELSLMLPSPTEEASVVERDYLATAASLAAEIRTGFVGLEAREVSESKAVWHGDIHALLPDCKELAPRLCQALRKLRPKADPSGLTRPEWVREALAYELIIAHPRQALDAFVQLLGSPGLDARKLFDYIQLSLVSDQTAARVARACHDEDESRRTVFLACVVLEPATPTQPTGAGGPAAAPDLADAGFGSLPDYVLRRALGCAPEPVRIPLTGHVGEHLEAELAATALRAVEDTACTTDPELLRHSPFSYILTFACPSLREGPPDLKTGELFARALTKPPLGCLPRVGFGRRCAAERTPLGESVESWTLLDETLSFEEERNLRVCFAQVETQLRPEKARRAAAARSSG